MEVHGVVHYKTETGDIISKPALINPNNIDTEIPAGSIIIAVSCRREYDEAYRNSQNESSEGKVCVDNHGTDLDKINGIAWMDEEHQIGAHGRGRHHHHYSRHGGMFHRRPIYNYHRYKPVLSPFGVITGGILGGMLGLLL